MFPLLYKMLAPPFFQLFNNTHFLVRKIFILDIEKNASDSAACFFWLTAIV